MLHVMLDQSSKTMMTPLLDVISLGHSLVKYLGAPNPSLSSCEENSVMTICEDNGHLL